jgi:hypothetical protein
MIGGSIPKLLQEAGEIKKALEKISATLPAGISAADMAAKITALETVVSELDAVNADRTRLVNSKGEQAETLSDFIVQVRLAVKAVCGSDSSEYEMIGGTRASDRKKPKKKTGNSD